MWGPSACPEHLRGAMLKNIISISCSVLYNSFPRAALFLGFSYWLCKKSHFASSPAPSCGAFLLALLWQLKSCTQLSHALLEWPGNKGCSSPVKATLSPSKYCKYRVKKVQGTRGVQESRTASFLFNSFFCKLQKKPPKTSANTFGWSLEILLPVCRCSNVITNARKEEEEEEGGGICL